MTTENKEPAVEKNNSLKLHYYVESVQKTDTPAGMSGDDWHSYIIGSGSSKIEGKKPGSLKAVTQHAQLVAEDLNARADIKNKGAYAANKKRVV